MEAAWNRGDASGYAAQFWDDGELVNIFGMILHGRQQIEQRIAGILRGALRQSRITIKLRKVRRHGPDLVVVDWEEEHEGITGAEGVPDGERKKVPTRFKALVERRNGSWLIAAAQNTRVSDPTF
jgi:uncharacterized protein (TIGR02246 family)